MKVSVCSQKELLVQEQREVVSTYRSNVVKAGGEWKQFQRQVHMGQNQQIREEAMRKLRR